LADDGSFKIWLAKFARAAANVSDQVNQVDVQVESETGPVIVNLPTSGMPAAALTPPTAPVVLEVNGTDLAPQILGNL
jgi:hypothetical protein